MAQNGVGKTWWGHSGCSQSGAYTGLWGRKEMSAERWWANCSLVKLSKCVGVVIISSVNGFVGTVCLDHPEVQEVPKATNFSKTI